MTKRILTSTSIAALLIAINSSAWARGNHNQSNQTQGAFSAALGFSNSQSTAKSASQSIVATNSNATGGTATSKATGGSASITYNVPNSQTVAYKGIPKRTPDVVMSNVQATANCRLPANAGGSGPGWGFGFGVTYEDETCIAGEAMRLGAATGRTALVDAGERIWLQKLEEIEQKRAKKAKTSSSFFNF